ncbi:nucleotidyltransferase family protein [Dyadobacter luticola]|uniref:Nucleotidyltransferase family protein n=1 Tax=Dyadobacter luticola TaxID=1979387 RepID=A0A5R9KYK8_9BACT|nr:nucleotidyltransferase family protein [Dyadobacter luticola]TLV01170.1 nucleotidyltransferase family protein [Dyadobacter luticola]
MNKVSPELSLLINACLDTKPDNSIENLDTAQLAKFLHYHRVRPQLLAFLHRNELNIGINEALAAECQKITILNLMLAREVLRITDQLQRDHIPCFAYKGILWAQWLFDNVGHREAGDIDLLVAEADILRATAALKEEGEYKPDTYREFLLSEPNIRKAFFGTDYHVLLQRELDSIVVELHWQIAYPRLGYDFPRSEWDVHSKTYQVARGNLKGFDNEYQFLLLLVHHGGKEKWSNLKYMADLAAYMNRYGDVTDWKKVFRLAGEKNILTLLTWSLGILKALGMPWRATWPDKIPNTDVSQLLEVWAAMPSQPANSTIPYFKQSLAMHDGLVGKSKVVVSHLKYASNWKLLLHKARWYRRNS